MRRKKARRFAVIAPAILISFVLLSVVFLPGAVSRLLPFQFDAKVRGGINSYLASRLGPGAQIGVVETHWRSIVADDIRLPLGKQGSQLSIASIGVKMNLLALMFDLLHPERAISGITVDHPRLFLHTKPSPSPDSTASWIGRISIPPEIYDLTLQFDSLRSASIVGGELAIVSGSDTLWPVLRVDGTIQRTARGQLHLAAVGKYLKSPGCTFSINGEVDGVSREMTFDARVAIPEGALPFTNRGDLPLTTSGGTLRIELVAADSLLEWFAESKIDCVFFPLGKEKLSFGSLELSLRNDTLLFAGNGPSSRWFDGEVSGEVYCFGRGPARAKIKLSSTDSVASTPEPLEIDVTGTLLDGLSQAVAACDSIGIYGEQVRDIRLRLVSEPNNVQITELTLSNRFGSLSGNGTVGFDDGSILVSAKQIFDSTIVIGGQPVTVREIGLTAGGTFAEPTLEYEALDANGIRLLSGNFSLDSSGVHASLDAASGGAGGMIALNPAMSAARVKLDHAGVLLRQLFDRPPSELLSIDLLDLEFHGDRSGGAVQFSTTTDSSARGLVSSLFSTVNFSGGYRARGADDYLLSGSWSGMSGDHQPFNGRAELRFVDDVLFFDQCFVDEVGSIEGEIDFARDSVRLTAGIDYLPYEKFPFRTKFMDRVRMNGTLTGLVQFTGSVKDPKWTASFSLVDGTILDVPDYWFNLDGHGALDIVHIDRFELGRDVSGIFQAEGVIDIARDSVQLTVVAAEARAEDFVLALTGRRGYVSGTLAGEFSASGRLAAPLITAEVTVTDGELLNEIAVDELRLRAHSQDEGATGRVIYLNEFSFFKRDVYSFHGEASAELRAGGKLAAHLEGSGDFLDLVDQVDRTFYTQGSDGHVRADFGGTLVHPEFLGAELSIENGRFSYVDATPDPANLAIHAVVSEAGEVTEGLIQLSTGGSWLTIRTIPADSLAAGSDLQPLIIPAPRLELGVLEFSTGDNGIPVRLPGFMKPDWVGVLSTVSAEYRPLTISAMSDSTLLIQGDADIRNGRMTFPFLPVGSSAQRPVAKWLYDRLREATWDVSVSVGEGNHYDVEITNLKDSEIFAPLRGSPLLSGLADYFDHLTIDAIVDPTVTPLRVAQCIDSSTFYVEGHLQTHRGRVEYLDQVFTIDYANADFDATNIMPILEGRAYTTGVDSIGRSVPVYLTMYQVDAATGAKLPRGRLDQITFVLEGTAGETPEKALGYLGYSATGIPGKAERLVATSVARALGRQWLDPIERKIEKWTWFDEVALSPGGGKRTSITRQLVPTEVRSDSLAQSSSVRFFTGSQVSVGKYLTSDVLFTYTGELAESQRGLEAGRLGLVHFWNVEYRLMPVSRDLVLDFVVEYDEAERKRDESVSLKYSFVLEP